jgi:DNA-binding XRE family transcriptional regulator
VGITIQYAARSSSSSDVQVPRLREQRHKRAYSQDELARRAKVSRTTIIKLEAGRDAWPQTVRKLAKALSCKPEDLQ